VPFTNRTVPVASAAVWTPAPHHDEVRAEAARWIEVILGDEMMPIREKQRRIGHELWAYTEIQSTPSTKYNLRYCTAAVLGPDERPIQHEHVVERRWLRDRLLAQPQDVSAVLALAVSCVTTADEAKTLTSQAKGLFGWTRYHHTGVPVIDRLTGESADLARLVAEQERLLSAIDLGSVPTS
jgi:hypothetical protein